MVVGGVDLWWWGELTCGGVGRGINVWCGGSGRAVGRGLMCGVVGEGGGGILTFGVVGAVGEGLTCGMVGGICPMTIKPQNNSIKLHGMFACFSTSSAPNM